jgi:hypothetical protein
VSSTTEPITVHFTAPITVGMSTSVTGDSRLFPYGSELEVTPQIIEASRDRFGASWLEDWLTNGEDEYRRGDKLIARRGPWPADICRLAPGSFERADAREAAVREAFQIADSQARADRRREIEAYFGPGEPTSRTHMNVVPGAAR